MYVNCSKIAFAHLNPDSMTPEVKKQITEYLFQNGGTFTVLAFVSWLLWEKVTILEQKYEKCMYEAQEKMRNTIDANTRVLERLEDKIK